MGNTRLSAMIQWRISKLKFGTTVLMMAACQRRVNTVPNDHLQAKTWTMIIEDRRLMVMEIAHEVGISLGSMDSILNKFFSGCFHQKKSYLC